MNKYLTLLFFISTLAYGQVGGEQIYTFLNVPTSARQAALGGNVLTLIDDVNQPLWNPSTINPKIDNSFAVNYVDFLADLSYLSSTYAHLVNRNFGTIHAGITYVGYGKFIAADENGVETGIFKASDLAFSVGYSYNIPWSSFYLGTNLKIINSTIANFSSFGFGADLGLMYTNENSPLIITGVVRNIGYQVTTYDGFKEKLPVEVAIGASFDVENIPLRWYVTIDKLQRWKLAYSNPSNSQTDIEGTTTQEKISFFNNAVRHFTLGAEFFPKGGFNIRLGYNFRRAKELQLNDVRTFAGFTAGIGLKMNKLKFNYAFSKYHPASNTNTFSLQIDLN